MPRKKTAKSRAAARRSACPVSFALDAVGDKWTLLILRDMVFAGKKHYGDFLASGEKIATNILAARLEKLEKEGILTKAGNPDNRTKHIYRLTAKGLDLVPLLIDMAGWGVKHDPLSEPPRGAMAIAKKGRQALIDHVVSCYREGVLPFRP